MSTSADNYIILGYKYDFDFFNEKYKSNPDDDDAFDFVEPILDSNKRAIDKGKLTCLFDGMNGEYVIIGVVLSKSNINGEFDEIIEIDTLGSLRELVTEQINLFLKNNILSPADLKTYAVTHYR